VFNNQKIKKDKIFEVKGGEVLLCASRRCRKLD
jgi:hypothetical protein